MRDRVREIEKKMGKIKCFLRKDGELLDSDRINLREATIGMPDWSKIGDYGVH